jgi:hypothetical protein
VDTASWRVALQHLLLFFYMIGIVDLRMKKRADCNQVIFEILNIIHVKKHRPGVPSVHRDDGGRVASKFSSPPTAYDFELQIGRAKYEL